MRILHNGNYAQKILQLTADTLILLDHDGMCVDFILNTKDWHLPPEELLIGQRISDFFPPSTYLEFKRNFDLVIKENVVLSENYKLPIGNEVYYFKCIIQQFDENLILCQYRDITERKRLSIQLERNNKELRAVEEVARLGRCYYDPETDICYYSGFIGLMNHNNGYNYDSYKNLPREKYILDVIYPDDREIFDSWLKRVLITEQNESVYYRIMQNDAIYYLHMKPFSFRNENGKKVMEAYVQNITAFTKQEADLAAIKWAMNNSFEDIYCVKMDGTLVFGNKQFRINFGVNDQDVFSKLKLYDLTNSIISKEFFHSLIEEINNSTEKYIRYSIKNPHPFNNQKREFDCFTYVVHRPGDDDYYWTFARDITERLDHEEQMKQMIFEVTKAKEKAEESDRMKSTFLANMSHEIRTPLNAIIGFSRIIAECDDLEERMEYFKIVESNNERLLLLINEILDLSRIESEKVQFTLAPTDLTQMCKEIYDSLALRCPKDVSFVIDEKSPQNITILTDKNRLTQVLSNLIGNSFKFTKQGTITFGFRKGINNTISFFVKDTGVGMQKEKANKIFDRFTKLNDFVQGSGLGLSICKTIVEKLGGTISVETEEEKGSKFLVVLPLKEVTIK